MKFIKRVEDMYKHVIVTVLIKTRRHLYIKKLMTWAFVVGSLEGKEKSYAGVVRPEI